MTMADRQSLDTADIPGIEALGKAAQLGNFTAAATALGISTAAVSRSIARLERRLGVALFARSARGVRLTAAGERFWRHCEPALLELRRAEMLVSSPQAVGGARVRVSASPVYAHYRLLPRIQDFRAAFPLVEVDLDISNLLVDLGRDPCDLAIRMGEPTDGALAYCTLEYATLGVFAAPAYLARHGEPRSIADLVRHRCIAFVHPTSGETVPWLLQEPSGQPWDLMVGQDMLVRSDFIGCLSWALAGSGLCQIYHFAAQGHVARGELVEVLRDCGGRARRFSVVHPRDRPPSAAAAQFMDFLAGAAPAATGRNGAGRRG